MALARQKPADRVLDTPADGEHILVCLSSAPSNAKIIRTAAAMAEAFGGRLTALFIETPDFAVATQENKRRLQEHRRLAKQLGAGVETVFGEDVPYQIAEYARLSGVTKIVLGRSTLTRKHLFGKPTLTEQLVGYIPSLDVYIIPDKSVPLRYRPRKARKSDSKDILCNVIKSGGILAGATALSLLFYHFGFTDSNIIMVYILGVLLTSVVTSRQMYSLVSSVGSVVIFNYLFTQPRFSLNAYGSGYPVTFLVMFLTAYITGTFALRYKEQARQSAGNAYRTKVLFDTDRLLSQAKDKNEILEAAGGQITKLLRRGTVIFENSGGELGRPRFYSPEEKDVPPACPESEAAAARWTLENNHCAGAFTDTMPDSSYYYLAIRVNERVYGVVGVEAGSVPLEAAEHGMLLSVLGETALALENEKNLREKEAAAVLAESERLRADLLRSISHDLRTPLTTISGNAGSLLENEDIFDAETKRQLYSDIYDDAMWLINLVENLLYATRIEDGRIALSTAPELVTEIFGEVLQHFSRKAARHQLSACCDDELLMVRADARLLVQVIVNLVDNAIKYTPAGSAITLSAKRAGETVLISVADTGGGIPDEEKEKVFEKFYRRPHKIADNRRGLGLGLFLCRAIVEAHGGAIHVSDNRPHGAVFSFSIPIEEVSGFEQQ